MCLAGELRHLVAHSREMPCWARHMLLVLLCPLCSCTSWATTPCNKPVLSNWVQPRPMWHKAQNWVRWNQSAQYSIRVNLSISMYITTQLNLYSLGLHPFHNVFLQYIIKRIHCFPCFYSRNVLDVVLDMVQYSTSYQMPINNIPLRLTSAWGETTIILLSVRDSSPAEEQDNIRKQKQTWVLKWTGMSHSAVSRQRVRSDVPTSSVLWGLTRCPLALTKCKCPDVETIWKMIYFMCNT